MIPWTTLGELGRETALLSVRAAVVVALIVVVQWIAGRRLTPQWRYALWTVVLLRLVMVHPFPAPFSIHNATRWAEGISPAPLRATAPTSGAPLNSSEGTPSERARTPETAPAASTAWTVGDGLTFLWALGMLSLSGVVLLQSFRMARAVSRGAPVTDPSALTMLEACRKTLGLRTWLVLLETDAVTTPTLMGALRPKLLLPKGLLANVPAEQLRHIFLHELTHLRRGDIWMAWFTNLLLVIHWFNPVLWWARKRMLHDRECACDAAVLANLARPDRAAYGGTMLDLAERLVSPPSWAPGMAGILETPTNLGRRIDMIARYTPHTRATAVIGAMLMLILAAAGLTDARAADPVLAREKAEMMGRVEDFFCHNFRDISARKSLEWGDVEMGKDGIRSIRYMCEARIWDKKTMILNRVFTFKETGEFVSTEDVKGFPKDKEAKVAATSDAKGMQALVEEFFQNNFRDISARKTLEWGEPETDKDGNRALRYKYEARIRDKDTIVKNQLFVFKPNGEFVRFDDVKDAPTPPAASQHQ